MKKLHTLCSVGVYAAEKYEFGCLGHLKVGVHQSGKVECEEFPYSLSVDVSAAEK